jgi:hypothetical protein
LVGKGEGKKPLRRHRCKWEDNIKMYFWEMIGGADWIHVIQDRDW